MRRIFFAVLFIFASWTTATASELPVLPFGPALTGSANDSDCSKSFQLAKRSIIEELPDEVKKEDIDWAINVDRRLVGFWFEDTGWCGVYDIADINKSHWSNSPHEQLDQDLESADWLAGLLVERKTDGEFLYFQVYDCPLCQ